MKNIVLFIIDSFNYSHLKNNRYLTPFLNKISSEGVSFENMFSQAPYTEAAVMNIYCGQNVLDNGGHIKRFKDAQKTIFEVMKDKGYVTFYNSFQPQCYASSLRRGIDYLYNNVGYDVSALWSYRLYLYADLLEKNSLNDVDISLLIEIFDDNFLEWLRFVNELKNSSEAISMIGSNSLSYDLNKVETLLNIEHKKYLSDKKTYILNVLSKKQSHEFLTIDSFVQDNKIKDKVFISSVKSKYYCFFKELDKLNRKLNKKNCKGVWVGPKRKFLDFVKKPSIQTLKNFGKSLLLAKNVYKDSDLYERISDNYEIFKNAPSVKTHIDQYINWETTRIEDKPSFSCIHVDDIHNPEVFFTYDSEDIDLIDSEFEDAKDVLKKIPLNYYGNITHDLSLRYIDSKLRYFYEQLSKHGLIDNTIVLICADHGFSFSGNPLRDSFVINMYLENYNIPCVITGSEFKGNYTKLCSSKDIPVLLSYLADGAIPLEFNGKNILKENVNYKNLFIEYCGGGCPDLKRRKLKIACFNEDWFVASELMLDEQLNLSNISELYDLKKDPLQLKNMHDKFIANDSIVELIKLINERKEQIKSSLIH